MREILAYLFISCEQALRDALAAGREKKGELATTSLEFEYLHRKSRCEMLIGEDDISNDIVTLCTCFSMFVYICNRFHFPGQVRSANGEPQENWRWNSNSRDIGASSPSFSRPTTKPPRELAHRLIFSVDLREIPQWGFLKPNFVTEVEFSETCWF